MSLTDKEIEGRLVGWLEREADRVGTGESFTPGAYVLARRRRTRKRVGAMVTGAAVVAALLPAGIWLDDTLNRPDRTPDVANTRLTTNAVETPDPHTPKPRFVGPVEKSIDVTKLPRGSAPAVPWYSAGVIHNGDQEIPLPSDLHKVTTLSKVNGGYLITVDRVRDATHSFELFLIKPGSAPKPFGTISGDPTVSSDGRQFAWDDRDPNPDPDVTTLFVADADSGQVLRIKRVSGESNAMRVRGFLGSAILLERSPNENLSPLRLWDPPTGRISDWYDAEALAGVTPDGSLAAVVIEEDAENECFTMLALPEKSQLWSSCEFSNRTVFSPDLRYLATANNDQDLPPDDYVPGVGEDPNQWYDDHPPVLGFYVKDLRTGANVLHLKDVFAYPVTWESDDTILFGHEHYNHATKKLTMALVRCTVQGKCELATDFVRQTSRWAGAYVLPDN